MIASSKQVTVTSGKSLCVLNLSHFFIFMTLAACLAACTKTHKVPRDLVPEKISGKKAVNDQTGQARPGSALLPDLQTVVPQHLQVVRAHQRDLLRFSNGIANTGAGALQFKPEFPLSGNPGGTQNAIQQLLDASGAIVFEETVSQFEYHPEHHHWHIEAVALFEIRKLSPTGPVVGGNSIKTTFCRIDWVKLEGNSKLEGTGIF